MCLVTKQRKARIANSDMKVYKSVYVGNNNVTSILYNFKWEKGVIYKEELVISKSNFYQAQRFDSVVDEAYKSSNQGVFTVVSNGFHATKAKERLNFNACCTTREFLIPKGSEIFTDKSGLIVSNQMMLL